MELAASERAKARAGMSEQAVEEAQIGEEGADSTVDQGEQGEQGHQRTGEVEVGEDIG